MGVNKRLRGDRIIGIVGVEARQRGRTEHSRGRLALPEHPFDCGESTVIDMPALDNLPSTLLAAGVVEIDRTVAERFRIRAACPTPENRVLAAARAIHPYSRLTRHWNP
jgi:hypothetical protein